jgi:hypothetical protein
VGCDFKNSTVGLRTFHLALLLAILVLPLQQQPEGVASFSSMLVVGQLKIKAPLPEHKLTFEIASLAHRLDQTPKINPSLLRIDLKQNLLVWPNIASDLTRSPPSAAAQSLS